MSLTPAVWRGSPWNSQQGVNGQGPWRGGLWRSERDSSAIAIRRLLFAQGQQGAMYIPKPIVLGQQVLYQDSAGTTPVTADGQPVGRMLDLHKGLLRGPELVTNGTFDDGLTQWAGGAVLQSGAAFIERDDAEPVDTNLSQVGSLGGGTYEVGFDIISGSGQLLLNENTTLSATPGRVTCRIAPASGYIFRLRCFNGANALVDNISVRELPGNHATQSTAASKPIYRTDGTLHWLEGDGVDDFMTLGDVLNLGTTGLLQVHGHNAAKVVLGGKSWAAAAGSRYFLSQAIVYALLRGQTNEDNFDLLIEPVTGQASVTSQWITRGAAGAHKVRLDGATQGSKAFTSTFDIQSPGRPFFLLAYPNADSTGVFSDYVLSGAWYGAVITQGEASLEDVSRTEQYIAKITGKTL